MCLDICSHQTSTHQIGSEKRANPFVSSGSAHHLAACSPVVECSAAQLMASFASAEEAGPKRTNSKLPRRASHCAAHMLSVYRQQGAGHDVVCLFTRRLLKEEIVQEGLGDSPAVPAAVQVPREAGVPVHHKQSHKRQVLGKRSGFLKNTEC